MRTSTRWTLVVLAVAAVIVAAFAAQLGGPPGSGHGARENPVPTTGERGAPEDIQRLAEARRRADLPPCPVDADNPGPAALRGVRVECAADGAEIAAGPALADRPVVLNLWAYWCAPCGEELPAMAEYQRRAGSAVTVVTVHQDENEGAGLQRLAELGVRLPTFQDGSRRIAAALHVPNVMPATVVLRRDGTVAEILPRAFVDADEIAAAVGKALK
jgi:thiol-disulfide isomerase/thioredoxin